MFSSDQQWRVSGTLRRLVRIVAVLLIVATTVPGAASADSTPEPSTDRKCPGEELMETLPERASLAVDGLAALPIPPSGSGRRDHQDVELSWFALPREEVCVAVFIEPNPGTEVFGESAWARVFQPEDAWVHRDLGVAGRYCYRLVAVSDDARGPFAETCAEVARVQGTDDGWAPSTVVLAGLGLLVVAVAALWLVRRRAFAGTPG